MRTGYKLQVQGTLRIDMMLEAAQALTLLCKLIQSPIDQLFLLIHLE